MQPGSRQSSAPEAKLQPPEQHGIEDRNPRGGPVGRLLLRSALLAAATLLSACATLATPGAASPDSPGEPAAVPAADSAAVVADPADLELAAGIALYDQGEYVQAIRSLLTSQWVWVAPLETRVTAQKYVAFSHCLLNRPKPCKSSFSDLLKMKPDFELAAAEAGHPQWSAAFKQAKKEAGPPSAPQPVKQSTR